jgi:hypothetical protein
MSTQMHHCFLALLISASLASVEAAEAQSLDDLLFNIESRWATAAHETGGRQHQKTLKRLLDEVRDLHASHPGRPGAAAWHGIVARAYMDAKGSSGSMRLAREARDALLKAESLDPLVLGGRVYANLGSLYSKVPSGFGGFGNKTRGIGYLWKAIVVDPDGIDSNYLYAEVLLKEKDYPAARDALLKANDAPVRPGHPEADRVRKLEVAALLGKVETRLQNLT